MKTNKQILKQSKEVEEITEVMEKINKSVDSAKGYTSIRIGNASVHLKENEESEHFSEIGDGELFLHLGDSNGAIYISSTIVPRFLQFEDDFGRIKHGRYFKKEEIVSIRLFDDAYERVINKLIEFKKYNNDIKKKNEEQQALLQSI